MFNYKHRDYLIGALEDHVGLIGLGVLFFSKVIDQVVTKL